MKRQAEWGHWGISFAQGEGRDWHVVASLPFAIGAQGPIDGFLGSPLRKAYGRAITDWIERGELPDGARCDVGWRWQYIPERVAHAGAPSDRCIYCLREGAPN